MDWVGRAVKLTLESEQRVWWEGGDVRIRSSTHLDHRSEATIMGSALISRNQHEVEQPSLPARALRFRFPAFGPKQFRCSPKYPRPLRCELGNAQVVFHLTKHSVWILWRSQTLVAFAWWGWKLALFAVSHTTPQRLENRCPSGDAQVCADSPPTAFRGGSGAQVLSFPVTG